MQFLPQARQAAEFMLVEPWRDLAFGLHAFLQLLECRQAGFELRVIGALGIRQFLRIAPFLFQHGLTFAGFIKLGAGFFKLRLLFFHLHFQVRQMRSIG